jgi:hypothetical protein
VKLEKYVGVGSTRPQTQPNAGRFFRVVGARWVRVIGGRKPPTPALGCGTVDPSPTQKRFKSGEKLIFTATKYADEIG